MKMKKIGLNETKLVHFHGIFKTNKITSAKRPPPINFFCGFSMGRNKYWARRVYDLCVYYMTGPPEGSTESGFMEKPRIEPATPGLQGIALIHYTTTPSP